ncbi:hypothetical protein KM043_017177 [Ampulex compressa]|nr:hypothetical protein KM043_017177 [Ampulex compressa]
MEIEKSSGARTRNGKVKATNLFKSRPFIQMALDQSTLLTLELLNQSKLLLCDSSVRPHPGKVIFELEGSEHRTPDRSMLLGTVSR